MVLVLNADGTLAGTISDGDIRRAFLLGCGPETSVSTIMNPHPHSLPRGSTLKQIKSVLQANKIEAMPIVDERGQIVDLISLHDFAGFTKQDSPVLLMAGGFGKQLYRSLKIFKTMLPMGNRSPG